MQITTKNFAEAIRELNRLPDVAKSREFRRVLRSAIDPIQRQAQANVNSRTGRTVRALEVGEGRNQALPSVYLKINKKIASSMWRGRSFPYPYAVEHGHRRAPAHPFFKKAVDAKRTETRRIIEQGIRDLFYQRFSEIGREFS